MNLPEGSLISYFSTLVKQHGGINLAQGIPGFSPPQELLDELKNIAHENIHQYPPGIGNFTLLEQLLAYFSDQFPLKKENMIIMQGATEALCLIFLYVMRQTKGGFTTLSFTPPYESYHQLPKQFGLPFIELDPDENKQLPLAQIKEKIESDNVRLIFLASPGNPHGIMFSKESVNALIELCQQKECFLVFDSVYRTLYFETKPYVPLSKLNPYLFIVDGFSKWFSITGWRVGFLIHDEAHCSSLRSLHDYTGLCANSVLQEALSRFIAKNNFGETYSGNLRKILAANYQFASKKLDAMGFNCKKPDGGYFVWAELPETFSNGFEFAVKLFDYQKVAVVPGIHFSEKAEKIVRFNIARPLPELTEGLEKISCFLKKNSEKT
ncbi:MAG TPA: pyridoxal phosphate-dependent aminotransferase [Bacteroidales bacterium]|nr:pyridoxal phosphate-dependent aminotransferase [Bacteroidales bacterium]